MAVQGMNFKQQTCESFLKTWRQYPSATLHWVLPKDKEGHWVMRGERGEVVMTHIPAYVVDYVWRERELAEDVFPDPNATTCLWHLVLKP